MMDLITWSNRGVNWNAREGFPVIAYSLRQTSGKGRSLRISDTTAAELEVSHKQPQASHQWPRRKRSA